MPARARLAALSFLAAVGCAGLAPVRTAGAPPPQIILNYQTIQVTTEKLHDFGLKWDWTLHACPDRLAYVIPGSSPILQLRSLDLTHTLADMPLNVGTPAPMGYYFGASTQSPGGAGTVALSPGSSFALFNLAGPAVQMYDLDTFLPGASLSVNPTMPVVAFGGTVRMTMASPSGGTVVLGGKNSITRIDMPASGPYVVHDYTISTKLFHTKNVLTLDSQLTVLDTPISLPLKAGSPTTGQFDVWFTSPAGNAIGAMTADGHTRAWKIAGSNRMVEGLTADPTGKIWFTEFKANKIGSLDPLHSRFVEYRLPHASRGPKRVETDAKGNVFWTESTANGLGLLHSGFLYDFALPNPGGEPWSIEAGTAADTYFFNQRGTGHVGVGVFHGL